MTLAQEALSRKLAFAAWWQSPRAVSFLHAHLSHLHDLMDTEIGNLDAYVGELDSIVSEGAALLDRMEREGRDEIGSDIGERWDEKRGYSSETRQVLNVLNDSDDLTAYSDRMADALQHRAQRLLKADTFFASAAMVDLVNAAYPSRPPEPLQSHHLIRPSGFVWLETPALLKAAPKTDDWYIGFDAVSWETRVFPDGDEGVVITIWTRTDVVGISRPELAATAASLGAFVPLAFVFRFGQEDTTDCDEVRESAHTGRWVQTMWSLMGQPLVTTGRVPFDDVQRALRKRAAREDAAGDISVITLRRKKAATDPDHEAAKRNWTHRWVVRGFWRQQWYPKTEEHRPIWINDFIKGPEDRPFLVKDRVYGWTR